MPVIQIVDAHDAHALIQRGNVMVIDVREPNEYQAGHIERAVSFPLSCINKETAQWVIPSLARNILVYCESGARSEQAAIALTDLGYTSVHDMGSLKNWPYGLVR